MNIESTSATITKTAEISNSTASSSSTTTSDNAASFKDELNSAKTQDPKVVQDKEATQDVKIKEESQITNDVENQSSQLLQSVQEKAAEKATQQIAKDKLLNEKGKISKKLDNNKISDPVEELSSKIATLSQLKNMTNLHVVNSTSDKISSKDGYGKTIKMDSKDITFFLNLVDNQQMVAQSTQANNQLNNANLSDNAFTQIKTEAAQSTVNVSQTLLDSLNDAAKTGKPFRIDFDNNIAVIMKVDKEGVLSANFIPGTAAVEAYLKNNIAGLRQSFDEQGLPYNQLSYSNQEKQQKQKQQKENEDE